MAASPPRRRQRVARELAEILDDKLFKALCEPVRVEIVKILTACGRSNVQSVAAKLPQDISVISRHLSVLHDAGVIYREKEGRRTFFEMDGATMADRMRKILARFEAIVPLCTPDQRQ